MALNPASNRVTRRAFVRAAMGSVGVLAAGGATVLGPARRVAAGKPAGNVIRNPLHIPPTVGPSGLSLMAAPATVDLGGGKLASALAYNGLFPGPTIVANVNDSASITLQNSLAERTMVHWHGMPVPNAATDGHPLYPVLPKDAYTYNFTIVRSGMMWYHPHPHMMTGEQIYNGLAGAFIVRSSQEATLGLPSGLPYEVPLILRDVSLDRNNNPVYTAKSSGFEGQSPLVNGTLNPAHDVDTALYRFRVLNGANTRIFRLALSSGAPFTLIGNDGGLLPTAIQLTEIDIAPAERLDLLVDFRGLPYDARVMLRDLNAGWNLLEFHVARLVSIGGSIPTGTLATIPTLSAQGIAQQFSFDGMTRINGREYDPNRIDLTVPFEQTERWRFRTGGNAPIPSTSMAPRSRSSHEAAAAGWSSRGRRDGRTQSSSRTARPWTSSSASTTSRTRTSNCPPCPSCTVTSSSTKTVG
jgi:FtsP/CotA-like multicopper oxidase with cupredoxin domain